MDNYLKQGQKLDVAIDNLARLVDNRNMGRHGVPTRKSFDVLEREHNTAIIKILAIQRKELAAISGCAYAHSSGTTVGLDSLIGEYERGFFRKPVSPVSPPSARPILHSNDYLRTPYVPGHVKEARRIRDCINARCPW